MDRNLIIKLSLGLLFFIAVLTLYLRAGIIEKQYQFSGVIQKLTYSDKGFPNVVIGGKEYFLNFPGEDLSKQIELGDSVIKNKGSRIYKLIKQGTKKVILSD